MCSIRCWLWTLDLAQRHNGPIICAAHASKDYSERLIVIVSQGIRTGLSGNLRSLHTLTRSDQAWPCGYCDNVPGKERTGVNIPPSQRLSHFFSGQGCYLHRVYSIINHLYKYWALCLPKFL